MESGPRSSASRAMERYACGDDRAFADVYDGLAPRLYRYLHRLAPEEAEDLLQATFLKMHDARGRFIEGSDVEPWAYAIARRLFIDRRRRAKWETPSERPEEKGGARNQADAEAIVGAWELSEVVRTALAELPPLQREAFLLIREEGLSMAQAAEVLGVTVAAVKLRAHRAYNALRMALEAAGVHDTGGRT